MYVYLPMVHANITPPVLRANAKKYIASIKMFKKTF